MSRRGFTLLETVVALACTAVVLAALYGAVLRTAQADQRTTAHADRVATARGALLVLASELEAVPASDRTPEFRVSAAADGAPWQSLRFVTGARGPAVGADDLPVVEYRVVPDNASRGMLVRVVTPRLGAPAAPRDDPPPLVDAVRRLQVRCFDGRTWSSTWQAAALPRAVEVALGVDDGAGGVEEVATTVTLPAAGGA